MSNHFNNVLDTVDGIYQYCTPVYKHSSPTQSTTTTTTNTTQTSTTVNMSYPSSPLYTPVSHYTTADNIPSNNFFEDEAYDGGCNNYSDEEQDDDDSDADYNGDLDGFVVDDDVGTESNYEPDESSYVGNNNGSIAVDIQEAAAAASASAAANLQSFGEPWSPSPPCSPTLPPSTPKPLRSGPSVFSIKVKNTIVQAITDMLVPNQPSLYAMQYEAYFADRTQYTEEEASMALSNLGSIVDAWLGGEREIALAANRVGLAAGNVFRERHGGIKLESSPYVPPPSWRTKGKRKSSGRKLKKLSKLKKLRKIKKVKKAAKAVRVKKEKANVIDLTNDSDDDDDDGWIAY